MTDTIKNSAIELAIAPEADRDLRERCLKLAIENTTGSPNSIVSCARAFYAFVTGESDRTPREKISAALEEAGVS